MTSSCQKEHAYYEKVRDREATPQVKGKVKRMIYKAHSILLFGSKLMMVLLDVRSPASDS